MGNIVHKMFPRRISLADKINANLKEEVRKVAKKTNQTDLEPDELDQWGNPRRSRGYGYYGYDSARTKVTDKVERPVGNSLPSNIRVMVRNGGFRMDMLRADDGHFIGKWLNKYSFKALAHKGNRRIRKMRKHLDSGIWLFLALAALSIAFLAVDGLYLLMKGIWTDGSGMALAADLASTSLVLAGFFLLMAAACWGARELTVEIVKVRNRNASRLVD